MGLIAWNTFYTSFERSNSTSLMLSKMGFSIAMRRLDVALKILMECLLNALSRVSCLIPSLISLRISLTTYLISSAVHSENSLLRWTLLPSALDSQIKSRYLLTSCTCRTDSVRHLFCSRMWYKIWGKSPVMSCRVWKDWSLNYLSRSSSVLGSVKTSLTYLESCISFIF